MLLSKLPEGLPVQLWGLLINSTMQYAVSFCVITEWKQTQKRSKWKLLILWNRTWFVFQFCFLRCSGKELEEKVTAAVWPPVLKPLGVTWSRSLDFAFLGPWAALGVRRQRGCCCSPGMGMLGRDGAELGHLIPQLWAPASYHWFPKLSVMVFMVETISRVRRFWCKG